jgi:hypothetical protein
VSFGSRVLRPRAVIGLLALLCGVFALVSIVNTSDSDDAPETDSPSAPDFDSSKLTTIHPKGGVPSLDPPLLLEDIASVDWLDEKEPVIAVVLEGESRAYPLRILTWHEIVNDEIKDVPIAVTYCPVCNSAVVFERPEIGNAVTSFEASGLLYRSNLVMYDRSTDSLWPQLTGLAMRGEMTGSRLLRLPVQIVSWHDFRTVYPRGMVLSEQTGFDRPYGQNPYPGLDSGATPPSEVELNVDDRLAPLDRVLGVRSGGDVIAYSSQRLSAAAGNDGLAVENQTVGGQSLVVIWKTGTRSALDEKKISRSRDVGAIAAFATKAGADPLTFEDRAGRIVDLESGSRWNIFGRATAGALKGMQLARVDSIESFWYQWASFHPRTDVWEPVD